MRKRWEVVYRDVDGNVVDRDKFVTRWGADRRATDMGGELTVGELQHQRARFTEAVMSQPIGTGAYRPQWFPRTYALAVQRITR